MRWPTLLLFLLPVACAAGPGEFLRRPQHSLGWPIEAVEPRVTVEFVYHGLDDAKRDPGFWDWMSDIMFGTASRNLHGPYGITLLEDDDTLLIADTGWGAIHALSLSTCEHQVIDGSPDKHFQTPVGVAALPGGGFAATDSTRCEVIIFDDDWEAISSFGSAEELGRPTGIAWDWERARLLVLDTSGSRLLSYDLDGNRLAEIGGPGEAEGMFNHPTNLFIAADGEVYVTDSLNFRVQVFDIELNPLRSFGIVGDGPGAFSKPKGIGLDSDGNVYVVDAMFDNVQVFSPDGELLLAFAGGGNRLGEMLLPTGLFIDRTDRIFVADSGNSRIQVFQYHPVKPPAQP